MAIRLEKSGELYFIRGSADPPAKKKGWSKSSGGLGLWLVLALLVMGMLFPLPIAAALPTVSHVLKGFLTVAQQARFGCKEAEVQKRADAKFARGSGSPPAVALTVPLRWWCNYRRYESGASVRVCICAPCLLLTCLSQNPGMVVAAGCCRGVWVCLPAAWTARASRGS